MRVARLSFGFLAAAAALAQTSLDHPDTTAIVKLEFGLAQAEPRLWTGSAAVSTGEIRSAWGWHFSNPDRIDGASGWSLDTRWFRREGMRYRPRYPLPNGVEVFPNGVFLSVAAPPQSRVNVSTNHGEFSFTSWLSFKTQGDWAFSTAMSRPSIRRRCTR